MTTVAIPKRIEKKLKNVSQKLGISQEDFLVNATLYYFKNLKEELNLQEELSSWERTSDKDLLKLENSL